MIIVGTKPRLYLRPHRELAVEAAIIAACARDPVSAYGLRLFVQGHFPWVSIFEIASVRDHMIRVGRVVEVRTEDRSNPLYALPETPFDASNPTAPAAAPRDIAHTLPA